MIDSNKINELNRVYIRYVDGETTNTLFKGNPIYLVGGNLPDIDFKIQAPNLWSPILSAGKMLGAGIQLLGTVDIPELGQWGHLSGSLDLRQKFVFQGSAPQNFTIDCMLINKEGWNHSIAPYLNELADWMLPRPMYSSKGTPLTIGQVTNEGQLYDYMATDKNLGDKEEYQTFLQYVEKAANKIKAWVGDTHILQTPKQLEYLNSKRDTSIEVGRLKFKDIYISAVKIRVPRSYMSSGDLRITDDEKEKIPLSEPDSVIITFQIQSMHQTTTANMKF